MSRFLSKKGELAVSKPIFRKIEAKLEGGLATIAQRTDVIAINLMMDYEFNGQLLKAGKTKVIVKGDAGLSTWAKVTNIYNGVEFVLCPEGAIIGVEIED